MQATEELRRRGYQHIIVGVTGNVMEDDVLEYLSAGVDMVLAKPLRMPQLQRVLDHISRHGSDSQPNMKLVEHENKLMWVSKSSVVSV